MYNNVVVVPFLFDLLPRLAAILSDDVIKLRGVYTLFIFSIILQITTVRVFGEIDRRVGERFRLTVFLKLVSLFLSPICLFFVVQRNQFFSWGAQNNQAAK